MKFGGSQLIAVPKVKLWLISLLVGCALGTLPAWPWYRLGESVETVVSAALAPGMIVNMAILAVAGDNGPDYSLTFVICASCAIYTALIYLILSAQEKRKLV